jgi:uncharacterized protein YejL (UPF0352 family)
VTDEVTSAVDAESRPSEEHVSELLSESKAVLERMQGVKSHLDDLEEGSIVLLEK